MDFHKKALTLVVAGTLACAIPPAQADQSKDASAAFWAAISRIQFDPQISSTQGWTWLAGCRQELDDPAKGHARNLEHEALCARLATKLAGHAQGQEREAVFALLETRPQDDWLRPALLQGLAAIDALGPYWADVFARSAAVVQGTIRNRSMPVEVPDIPTEDIVELTDGSRRISMRPIQEYTVGHVVELIVDDVIKPDGRAAIGKPIVLFERGAVGNSLQALLPNNRYLAFITSPVEAQKGGADLAPLLGLVVRHETDAATHFDPATSYQQASVPWVGGIDDTPTPGMSSLQKSDGASVLIAQLHLVNRGNSRH